MAKKIIVFADGTGNAFFTQESNVWRIYQAIDASRDDQIAYYIPGVGTSSFRPWAIFDGATGVGVPANVRKLYRFLSWNYEEGAEIYMFGFSRGAFTIRTLIDLIHKEGLLPTTIQDRPITRAEMWRNSSSAWRSYCRKDPVRNQNLWVMLGARAIRDASLSAWDKLRGYLNYEEVRNEVRTQGRDGEKIAIEFAGLFDTVEAYGVPVEELRVAVHVLLFPICFGDDHGMSSAVRRIRHALSLDDERQTFHPIRVALSKEDRETDRIQEVWFAGVHSDVGGGYPDSALAHVPLVWMLEELEKAAKSKGEAQGLVLKHGELKKFRANASAFGPLHDSRGGVAVLYRYDPRTIKVDKSVSDYLHPVMHHSVVERIVAGDDQYAPLILPTRTAVYMPDGSIFTYQAKAFQQMLPPSSNMMQTSAALQLDERMKRAEAAVARLCEPNQDYIGLAMDDVWRRRVNYFVILGLLLTIFSLPIAGDWIEDNVLSPFGEFVPSALSANIEKASDGILNTLKGLGDAILSVTPSYLSYHADAFLRHPWISLALFGSFGLALAKSGSLQDRIRDYARRAWSLAGARRATDDSTNLGKESNANGGLVRILRTNALCQSLHKTGGTWVLPSLYALLFIIAPVSLAANRMWFNYLVGSGKICYGSPSVKWLAPGEVAEKPGYSDRHMDGFATNNPCWASGWAVERGAAYRVTLNVEPDNGDEPWLDQLIMTDLAGFDSKGLMLNLATLVRRWPFAAWFQPIARVSPAGDVEWPLIPLHGDGALSARAGKCTRLPTSYEETKEHAEFCRLRSKDPQACDALARSLKLGDPLPRDELVAATKAWEASESTFDNKPCLSAFPRRTFVSDFVAQQTGELFLFVNDAIFFPAPDGKPQGFYTNNTGTATFTLQRAPSPATTTSIAAKTN
jgi:hypothetical protein